MSRFVSVCQHLALRARVQPDAPAVEVSGRSLSAADLAGAIVQMAIALEVQGVRPGMRLGLESQDRVAHLLLILAAQCLGVTTVSFSAIDLTAGHPLIGSCDLVVFSDAEASFEARRRHRATDAWLQAVLSIPLMPDDRGRLERAMAPDEVVRIAKTSGTTGRIKAMAVTAGAQMARIARDVTNQGPNAGLRYLALYNLQVEGNLVRCCNVLVHGGTVRFTALQSFFADAAPDRPNYAMVLTGDGERLLGMIPADWHRPPVLSLSLGGGALPGALRQALLARIATDIQHRYSSNETGLVAVMAPDGVGTLAAGVDAMIRDAAGGMVAGGEQGLISVRSPSVVSGYLDDAALTGRHFADGWFHTSDWGFKPDAGHLVVLGRADDMLNIGGLKVPATLIEAELGDLPGVARAAVVSVDSHLGVAHLAAMLEVAPGFVQDGIIAAATALLQRRCTCRLALTDRLPRTESGKIRKAEIVEWFRRDMGFEV